MDLFSSFVVEIGVGNIGSAASAEAVHIMDHGLQKMKNERNVNCSFVVEKRIMCCAFSVDQSRQARER